MENNEKNLPGVLHKGVKYELTNISEKAFLSPMLVKLNESDLMEFLLISISKVCLDCGQEMSPEDLSLTAESLKQSLENDFVWFTHKELPIIFAKGRRGDFGKWYGLNTNTFEKWIASWRDTERQERIKKHKSKIAIPEKKVTQEETDKIIEKHIIESVMHYRNTKEVLHLYLYDILYKKNVFPVHSAEYRDRIKEKTIKRLQSKKEKATALDDMRSFARKIKGLENISSLMKETVLMEYFEENTK